MQGRERVWEVRECITLAHSFSLHSVGFIPRKNSLGAHVNT